MTSMLVAASSLHSECYAVLMATHPSLAVHADDPHCLTSLLCKRDSNPPAVAGRYASTMTTR